MHKTYLFTYIFWFFFWMLKISWGNNLFKFVLNWIKKELILSFVVIISNILKKEKCLCSNLLSRLYSQLFQHLKSGSTSSFWTHSALVFSWATSRKDCSTSQVARQSEKSLWPPTWDVEWKDTDVATQKCWGGHFNHPRLRCGTTHFFEGIWR